MHFIFVRPLRFFSTTIMLIFSRTLFGDPDTLWHIRTGQWILDHAQFPTVDFYSYTAAVERWISTEWLSEIFYTIAYKIGEWHGVVILSALLCAAVKARAPRHTQTGRTHWPRSKLSAACSVQRRCASYRDTE